MFRRPVVMRRGPGLLGAVALGGVAYAAGHAGASRAAAEQRQDDEQRQAPPQPHQVDATAVPEEAPQAPVAASSADRITQLEQLGRLRDSGVLTPEEFEREKRRVLA